MEFVKTKMLAIAMLLSVAAVNADVTTGGRSVFMPVANGGTAVSNLGWSGSVYQHDSDELRACFKVQAEFGQNTKRDQIGKYLSPGASNTFVVGPVNTAGTANDTDLNSINLLISSNVAAGFKSSVTFKPKAQDFVADLGIYVDLSEWLDGLYLSTHMPLQHARWEVEIDEPGPTVAAVGGLAGQLKPGAVLTDIPYADVTAAFKGDKTTGNATAWSFGKIVGKQTKTKLGDATVTLGYNFINKEHCHLGLGVQGLLGAGGKTKAEYMFEPIIGYAGRYGVGGQLAGGARLWDKDDDHQLTANMNVSVVHLFGNNQVRSYDITNCGDYSRYLLVRKWSSFLAAAGAGTDAAGQLNSMINIGTQTAKIGLDVAYNGNVSFCWQMGNMSLDFGYQLAGHGKEKHEKWIDTITDGIYTVYDNTSIDLDAATASQLVKINGDASGTATAAAPVAANAATFAINNDRLNKDSGLMKAALEHCVFAGLNYNWADSEWAPGVGVLGSYHIAGSDNNTFDRWSVGFQFNFCV
jgi:hypothetical protein